MRARVQDEKGQPKLSGQFNLEHQGFQRFFPIHRSWSRQIDQVTRMPENDLEIVPG